MKVLLSTIGTRGDVQPLLALELRHLGHDAVLCIPPNFEDWIKGFGLRCFTIGPDLRRFTAPASSGQSGALRAGMVALSREQKRQLAAGTVREQFRVLSEAAQGCDLIVAATALQIAARSIAEQAYCPVVLPAAEHSGAGSGRDQAPVLHDLQARPGRGRPRASARSCPRAGATSRATLARIASRSVT
jgi:vancomycin aglycone glucosyltransferase